MYVNCSSVPNAQPSTLRSGGLRPVAHGSSSSRQMHSLPTLVHLALRLPSHMSWSFDNMPCIVPPPNDRSHNALTHVAPPVGQINPVAWMSRTRCLLCVPHHLRTQYPRTRHGSTGESPCGSVLASLFGAAELPYPLNSTIIPFRGAASSNNAGAIQVDFEQIRPPPSLSTDR